MRSKRLLAMLLAALVAGCAAQPESAPQAVTIVTPATDSADDHAAGSRSTSRVGYRDDLGRARDLASSAMQSTFPKDDLASSAGKVRALAQDAGAAYDHARLRATMAAERNRTRREAASLWIWFVSSVLAAGESTIPPAIRGDQEQVDSFMQEIKDLVHQDLHQAARLLQDCADEPDAERIAEACRALLDCTVVLYERGPAEGRACEKAAGSGVGR